MVLSDRNGGLFGFFCPINLGKGLFPLVNACCRGSVRLTLCVNEALVFLLFSGRSAAPRVLERYRARTQEQTSLNRGLSRSMGSLPIQDLLKGDEGAALQYSSSDYHPNSESPTELYAKPPSLQGQHSYPYLHPLHPQQKGRPVELDRRSLPYHIRDGGISQARKTWASSVDLAYIDPEALRFGALEDARRGSSAISSHSVGRLKSPLLASRERDSHYSEFGGLKSRKPHHHSALSVGSGITGAYDRIKEKQRKLQVLRQAVDGEYISLT